MSLLAPFFLAALLLFLQGPLLQFSCAFTGGRPPGYWRALGVAMTAALMSGLVGTAWSCTFGLLISFFSTWLSWGLSIAVAGLVASTVYRNALRIPFPQALAVTLVHNVLSWGLAAAAWYLYRLF